MNKARVIEEHKTNYIISDGGTELLATVRGSFFTENAFPKVGDYVAYSAVAENKAVIEEVLPRTSIIVRKAAHTGGEQVIVANVDIIFIVMGLDDDFNLSRLERYLLLARQSNVAPVVVLNKSDGVDKVEDYVLRAKEVAGDASVYAVSALTGEHMDELLAYFTPETTTVLLGSSGAGKSTITNWLLSEDRQAVNEVRTDDSHGRHTTTSRQLFLLPRGGYLIDTPGMRELGVLNSAEDEEAVFAEIDALGKQCRFANCDHEKSAGCAILDALREGVITERQLKNYQKLLRERLFEESKHDEESSWQYRQKQKKLHKGYKKIMEGKRFDRGF